MAARKRAQEKPVTFKELEQVIDTCVETQRSFLLMVARRVTAEAKEQEKPARSSKGRKRAR